jgi:hypothetical protein
MGSKSLMGDDSAHLLTFAHKASILACKNGVAAHKGTKTDHQYLLRYLELKGSSFSAAKQAEIISDYATSALEEIAPKKKTESAIKLQVLDYEDTASPAS